MMNSMVRYDTLSVSKISSAGVAGANCTIIQIYWSRYAFHL